jgi:hypothetical protein
VRSGLSQSRLEAFQPSSSSWPQRPRPRPRPLPGAEWPGGGRPPPGPRPGPRLELVTLCQCRRGGRRDSTVTAAAAAAARRRYHDHYVTTGRGISAMTLTRMPVQVHGTRGQWRIVAVTVTVTSNLACTL